MKIAQYLMKEKSTGRYSLTSLYFKDDQDFIKLYGRYAENFWRLPKTEIEPHINISDLKETFKTSDVEEVVYNKYPLENKPDFGREIPTKVYNELYFQYEWRYQKSMLWFITPEKFAGDDDFKNYISKAVVLDLIDFRRFVKPVHKEIGI